MPELELTPIGTVKRLSDNAFAIEILPRFADGLHGIQPGDRLDVHYWMHRLSPDRRGLLRVHPRGDRSRPIKGVFGLRSPMRPNPVGVSAVRVQSVEGSTLTVTPFDAEDGSPVVDLKSSRAAAEVRRLTRSWGAIHDTIVRALEDALDEPRVREILYRPMFELGRRDAPEPKPDAPAIGEEIMKFEASWELKGRVVEERPDRFVREVSYCPWTHLSPMGCKILAWYMEGICRGMNEQFTYRLEQLIPEGAERCVWSITRESGAGS